MPRQIPGYRQIMHSFGPVCLATVLLSDGTWESMCAGTGLTVWCITKLGYMTNEILTWVCRVNLCDIYCKEFHTVTLPGLSEKALITAALRHSCCTSQRFPRLLNQFEMTCALRHGTLSLLEVVIIRLFVSSRQTQTDWKSSG